MRKPVHTIEIHVDAEGDMAFPRVIPDPLLMAHVLLTAALRANQLAMAERAKIVEQSQVEVARPKLVLVDATGRELVRQ